jgi:hypothetical protein
MYYLLLPIILTDILRSTNIQFVGVTMDDHIHHPSVVPSSSYNSGATAADGADGVVVKSELPLSYTTTPKHNSVLTLSASCKFEGFTLPFDVGIIASSLNVYHHNSRLGHLIPLNREVTIYQHNRGNFSLLASLHIDNITSFHEFAGHLLQDNTVQWRISDDHGVSIRLHVPFFGTSIDLYVPSVHLDKTVIMKGCGAFKNTSLELFYLDDLPSNATGGNDPGLNVHMTARVYNPSTANVTDMGRIHFDMSYSAPSSFSSSSSSSPTIPTINFLGTGPLNNQLRLGYLETDESLSVTPGWNTLRGTGRFNAQGDLANSLIHNFMMGLPTILSATAPFVNASTDPLFSEFVGGLSLHTTLAGTPKGLVHKGQWLLSEKLILEFLNPFRKKPLAVPFVSELKNPFGAVVFIESSDFDVIYENTVVGTVHHENMTTVIPRNGTSWTNPVNIMVDLKIPGMSKITTKIVERMLYYGSVDLSIRGNFTFTSGGLSFAPKNYEQYNNVPCCIGWPGVRKQNRTCRPVKNRTIEGTN